MIIGQHEYKLLLLDTNIIREIILNKYQSGEGFIGKFINGSLTYAPCFSIYNVVEIMPYDDIFQNFLDYFSILPCLMFFPTKIIVTEEFSAFIQNRNFIISGQVANAYTPIIKNSSYHFRSFIESMLDHDDMDQVITDYIHNLPIIASSWENQRNEMKRLIEHLGLPKIMINEEFYKSIESESIEKDLSNYGFSTNSPIELKYFPSLRIIEYSHYNRVHLTRKTISPNDVMDIQICSISPYINAVITEAFQANVYHKARRIIPQLKELEIFTVRDIRVTI